MIVRQLLVIYELKTSLYLCRLVSAFLYTTIVWGRGFFCLDGEA